MNFAPYIAPCKLATVRLSIKSLGYCKLVRKVYKTLSSAKNTSKIGEIARFNRQKHEFKDSNLLRNESSSVF